MKGGDVVILYAAQGSPRVSAPSTGPRLSWHLTGDEEDAGPLHLISRKPLIDAAKRSDIALAFGGRRWQRHCRAPGNERLAAGRQRKTGAFVGDLLPGSSYGAIYEAARILNAFREKLSNEQYLTFNPAVIVGGTDVTYDSTKIAGDGGLERPTSSLRGSTRAVIFVSSPRTSYSRLATQMRAIVAEHLPGTIATITFEDGNPAMPRRGEILRCSEWRTR